MARGGGLALRLISTFIYFLTFCCAAIILGFYSYFLAVMSDRNTPIPKWVKAVEGISGVAVVYTLFALILTCCLGGVTFFAFLGVVLDLVFVGGFVALAVLTRDATHSCSGNNVRSPIGRGPSNSRDAFGSNGFGNGNGENVTYQVSLGTACRYNKACFAVAIIGAFVFLLAALFQVWLGRHHKREAAIKNTTAPKRGGFFGRRGRKTRTTHSARDAELAAAEKDHHAMAPNHVEHHTAAPGTGGYHTHPTGTSVNPYGYDNTRNAATNY